VKHGVGGRHVLDMRLEQGSERAKALLDSNARKQDCVLKVTSTRKRVYFGTFMPNPQKKLMTNPLRSLEQIPASALHNAAHTYPFFPGAQVSARAEKVLDSS
jgi:hypothetical protein